MGYEYQLELAAAHLHHHDSRLRPLIDTHGLPTIRPHTDYFQALAGSIIPQQLSTKAAASITRRFIDNFDGTFPTPAAVLATSDEALRGTGLSRSKITYIKNLSRHICDGSLAFNDLVANDDELIIARLTDVKGIGAWTAHMFLIFCLGRLNILAHGDLGIRSGIRHIYGLSELPAPHEVVSLAAQQEWAPYRSVACWYIWRALDTP